MPDIIIKLEDRMREKQLLEKPCAPVTTLGLVGRQRRL